MLLRVIRNVQDTGSNRTYADAGIQVNVLGMRAVSGLDETWLLELHDSFASIEDVDRALGSARPLRNSNGTDANPDSLIALYRPGLSYRPEDAAKSLPKALYLMRSIYRIQAGNEAAFADVVKLRRARRDSINLDRPEIAYEVIMGAMSGTYILVAPLAALKTLDDGLARTPNYGEATKAAAGTEMGQERMLLRIDPALSYVSSDFASADPDFWNPKAPTR